AIMEAGDWRLLLRWVVFRLLVAYVLVLALVLGVRLAFASHGHWVDHYQDALGRSCCGVRDCEPVHARLLGQDATTAVVEVEGLVLRLPVRSVHVSEDLSDWYCANYKGAGITQAAARCVFLAAAM